MDAVQEFNAAVEKKMDRGLDRQDAVKAVANQNRELHQRYLLATNSGAVQKRQIIEKFS